MKNSLKPRELWDISMIPDNVDISENNLPCAKNKLYGYGKRFNVYYTGSGNCYHNRKCPSLKNSKSKAIIHRYAAVEGGMTPCSICKPKTYIDDWYKGFIDANSNPESSKPITERNKDIPAINYKLRRRRKKPILLFGGAVLLIISVFIYGFIRSQTTEHIAEISSQKSKYENSLNELNKTVSEQKNIIDEYSNQVSDLTNENETLTNENTELKNTVEFYEDITNTSGGIVYVTKNGNKYHKRSCSYLNQPTFEMSYSDAVKSGYTPCSTCY